MANGRLDTTWRQLRSLLGASAAADTGDAQLLAHFRAERDNDVFTELMRRHGPMVYGVCRRILMNPHDAEDAVQATFLILSHKASSIRKTESLSCWLHGVALRVANRLKRDIRRRKEQPISQADVSQSERDVVSWREVQRLLDEELSRLPEQFRQPLILCYLEGKTRDEAAEILGWSLPTFRGRLERGRERLRWRLERRGVTLSVALLATLAAANVEAAFPSLPHASAQAITLAAEVMRTMFLSKVKIAMLWCIAALLLSVGVSATAYRCVAVETTAPAEPVKPPTPPQSSKPTPPEEDGVVKDYQAHLDRFRLTIALIPQELDKLDERYPVRDIRLMVANVAIGEPGGKGTVFAHITKEQAAKIIIVLAKDNFFRASVADPERLAPPNANYVQMWASYQNDDKTPPVRRWRTLDWDRHMVQHVQALRQCVDGEAAKRFDQMLKSLEEERKPR